MPIDETSPGPYIVDGTGGNSDLFEPGIDDLEEPLLQRLGDYLSNNTLAGHENGYEPTRGNRFTVRPGSEELKFTDDVGISVPIVTAGGRTSRDNAFSPTAGQLDINNVDTTFARGNLSGQMLGDLLSKGGAGHGSISGHDLLQFPESAPNIGLHRQGHESSNPSPSTADSPEVVQLTSQALLSNRWNPRRGDTAFDPTGDLGNDARVAKGALGANDKKWNHGPTTLSNTVPIAGIQSEFGRYNPDAPPINFDQLRRVGLAMMLRAAGEPGFTGWEENQPDPLSPAASSTLAPGAAQLGVPRSVRQVTDANEMYGAPGAAGGAGSGGDFGTSSARPYVMAGFGAGTPTLDGLVPFSFGSFNHFLEPFQNDIVASRALAGVLALGLALAIKPVQGIMSAMLEPVTALEATARIIPIGGAKVGKGPIFPIGLAFDDIAARLDAQGQGPLLHKGRSSRRNITFSPAVWESLGFTVPDNQAGMDPTNNYRTSLTDKPDPVAGAKVTSYFLTVERGIMTLFGIINVGQAPGFYITVCREIVRDVIMTVHRIAKRAEQAATGGTSAAGAINAVSDTIMEMMNTKMTKFVNVLATIGNASLKQDPRFTGIGKGSASKAGMIIRGTAGGTSEAPFGGANVAASAIDALPPEYSLSSKLARGGNPGRGTGFRAGNALTMLLVPEEFKKAAAQLPDLLKSAIDTRDYRSKRAIERAKAIGGKLAEEVEKVEMMIFPGLRLRTPGKAYDEMTQREDSKNVKALGAGEFDGNTKTSNFRSKSTITPDERMEIENELEAEYMPFYFHDLRTNEIVAFQAFLESLADNYSVQHNSIDAYGRIDAIKIYKKTQRSVNLGFTIACTNPADFDIMYAKINKLVTMIYPQWSEGDFVTGNDGELTFAKPFSQIPTASPVIRLRIGDIIRTNNSKFNMLRLFGMGSANFKVGTPIDPDASLETRKAMAEGNTDFTKLASEDDNAVLKSFKAVGGRGLAGVITSMNFNWLGGNSWEVARYRSRAPKLCKLTIAFSPIHDIAPGIDAKGMNRAPLYPVGDTMAAIAGQTGDESELGRLEFDKTKEAVDEVLDRMIDKTGIVDYTS